MKVDYSETVSVRGQIDLAIRDITFALKEHERKAVAMQDDCMVDDHAKQRVVHEYISDVHQCLAAVTSEMIERVSQSNRRKIASVLREEANRWDCGE